MHLIKLYHLENGPPESRHARPFYVAADSIKRIDYERIGQDPDLVLFVDLDTGERIYLASTMTMDDIAFNPKMALRKFHMEEKEGE